MALKKCVHCDKFDPLFYIVFGCIELEYMRDTILCFEHASQLESAIKRGALKCPYGHELNQKISKVENEYYYE